MFHGHFYSYVENGRQNDVFNDQDLAVFTFLTLNDPSECSLFLFECPCLCLKIPVPFWVFLFQIWISLLLQYMKILVNIRLSLVSSGFSYLNALFLSEYPYSFLSIHVPIRMSLLLSECLKFYKCQYHHVNVSVPDWISLFLSECHSSYLKVSSNQNVFVPTWMLLSLSAVFLSDMLTAFWALIQSECPSLLHIFIWMSLLPGCLWGCPPMTSEAASLTFWLKRLEVTTALTCKPQLTATRGRHPITSPARVASPTLTPSSPARWDTATDNKMPTYS